MNACKFRQSCVQDRRLQCGVGSVYEVWRPVVTQVDRGETAELPPREVERLRPSECARPASDTDDTLWEELLQGPDSASTASSDSEGDGPPCHGRAPPNDVLSSEEESIQPVSSHNPLGAGLCGFWDV